MFDFKLQKVYINSFAPPQPHSDSDSTGKLLVMVSELVYQKFLQSLAQFNI